MKKYILLSVFLISFANIALGQFFDEDENNYYDGRYFRSYFERPKIIVNYGLSNLRMDGVTSSFENTSLGEIKLGYSGQWTSWYGKKVLKYDYGYATFGAYSTDLDFRTKTTGYLPSTLWRLGLGMDEGYNIKAGSVGIIPYTSGAIMWSKLDMNQLPDSLSTADSNLISLYNKSVRFGNVYNGGLDFQFTKMFGFNMGYERANIYRRHIFFMNFLSLAIEQVGAEVIDGFTGSILDHEPIAGALVNFVLKNLYYYAYNQLRSQQMNWPFGGEPCLNYSTIKAGFSFSF